MPLFNPPGVQTPPAGTPNGFLPTADNTSPVGYTWQAAAVGTSIAQGGGSVSVAANGSIAITPAVGQATTITRGGLTITAGDITASAGNSNLTLGTGTITSGAINGQTISSAANFTGSLTVATNLGVTAGTFTQAGGAVSILNNSNFNTSINTGSSTGSVTIGNGAAGVITIANHSNTAATMLITDGTTSYYSLDTRTTTNLASAHTFSASGPTLTAAAGTDYSAVTVGAFTVTLTGSTAVTNMSGVGLNILQPTITDASAVNVSTASTVFIAGAPIAAGSVSIINGFALAVAGSTQVATLSVTGNVQMTAAANFQFGTTTGTKMGTATNQKLGFWNATAVVQPNTVGTATGYTAGATAATFHSDDTYSGNTGTTSYTVNGIVFNLKSCGILAT